MKSDGCLVGLFCVIVVCGLLMAGMYFITEKAGDLAMDHDQEQTERAWAYAAKQDAVERGMTERARDANLHREQTLAMVISALAAFAGGMTITDLLAVVVVMVGAVMLGYAVGLRRLQ